MLYRKIIIVCSQIHTKHIHKLCGQKLEFPSVKRGGNYSNLWALRGRTFPLQIRDLVALIYLCSSFMLWCVLICSSAYNTDLQSCLWPLHSSTDFFRTVRSIHTQTHTHIKQWAHIKDRPSLPLYWTELFGLALKSDCSHKMLCNKIFH